MKDEWAEYLKSVGFQDPLLQRADSALRFYSDFACIDIDLIFVSEYRDSEKGRVYESLWVFSEDCAGETKFVEKQENFDLIRLSNNVDRWVVRKTEFEFDDKATEASRLTASFSSVSDTHGILKASGTNCLRLAEALRKFIMPGLASAGQSALSRL